MKDFSSNKIEGVVEEIKDCGKNQFKGADLFESMLSNYF